MASFYLHLTFLFTVSAAIGSSFSSLLPGDTIDAFVNITTESHNVNTTESHNNIVNSTENHGKKTSSNFNNDATRPTHGTDSSLGSVYPFFAVPTKTGSSGDNSSIPTTTMVTTATIEKKRTTCFPGFECLHGYCSSEFSCQCNEGWTGVFCHKPCPENCGPDAHCGTDAMGSGVCLCLDRSIRYHPEKGCTPDVDTTTMDSLVSTESMSRPLALRECFPGFRCKHGYCQFGVLRCVCDKGWVGHFCHVECTVDCNNHGICAQNGAGVQYCDCDPGFSGSNCGVEITNTTLSSLIHLNTNRTSENTEKGKQTTSDHGETTTIDWISAIVASNDIDLQTTPQTSSPLATQIKECAPGFPCAHGTCVPGRIKCECEPGWQGHFCHKAIGRSTSLPSSSNRSVTDIPASNITKTPVRHLDWLPLEGHGNLSAFHVRACSPNFICQYGNCSNSTTLKCDCEPGFTGFFCHKPCPYDCGENAVCKFDSSNKTHVFCECIYPYSGVNCSVIRQTPELFTERGESTSHWYAVGVAIGLVLILMLLFIVLPYILWRRRNITVMKIVFWLRNVEEDDGRAYDGFVAYASSDSDRKFVQQELIPNLEERLSFALCIHERDFMPGNYITNNINEAIRMSRRTLIIVSSSFVKRKWCQFEFEVAVREMVEQKHRILPIIIGDISKIKHEMSDSLKHILSTVTYIEYPGVDASEKEKHRFWKKIKLSMPKKHPKQLPVASSTELESSEPSSSISSDSAIASEQIEVSIPSPACHASHLPGRPTEKNMPSTEVQLRGIVRVPASRVNRDRRGES